MTRGEPSPLRRLLKQGGIYALGNMAIKASGLLLAPLYLNEALFSQVSFGQLVILEATAQLLIPMVGLGLATGMIKFMADPELEDDRAAIPFSTLVPTIVCAALFTAVLWPAAGEVAGLILSDSGAGHVVRLLLIYVALKVVGYVPLTLIRLKSERPSTFRR
jgi:O-antigen/teichoic acid export membrane protein